LGFPLKKSDTWPVGVTLTIVVPVPWRLAALLKFETDSFLSKRFLQFLSQFGYAHLVEGDTIFVIVEPLGPRNSEP
jgi:hypothetical protein